MSTVIIKSVRLEGFRSYTSPALFKFEQAGLFHIQGLVGAGKTTIFSALSWCLFKLNLNGVNNDALQSYKHLRTKEYKGTRVVVDMVVGKNRYMIARHINYKGTTVGLEGGSSLIVLVKPVNDKSKWSDKHIEGSELYKNDQQGYINRLLGINGKIFINSIVFGQRMARLVKADGKEKRELFEKFFDLVWIDVAKEKATNKVNELTQALTSLGYRKISVEESLDSLKLQLSEKQELIEHFKVDRKERLVTIKGEYNDAVIERDEISGKLTAKNKLLSKRKKENKPSIDLRELYQAYTSANNKYEQLNNTLSDYKKQVRVATEKENNIERQLIDLGIKFREVKDKCPYCDAPLKKEKVKSVREEINNKIAILKQELITIQVQRTKFIDLLAPTEKSVAKALEVANLAYEEYNDAKAQDKLDDLVNEIAILEDRLKTVNKNLSVIADRFKKEKAKQPPVIDTNALEEKISALDEELELLNSAIAGKSKELEYAKFWAEKGFGSKGVKSYIFSAMLEQLNTYTEQYGIYFGYKIHFSIDLSKVSRPFVTKIFNGEHELDYNNLSGGQQQAVDVCLALAMSDLVSYKTQFNIMALDECLEGLDETNISLVAMLMHKIAEKKAVYVITHHPTFIALDAQKVYVSGGTDGVSIIE